ncbi:hypothetical protein AGR2A_Cc80016 [Agrobacterium genomosp. 2 str. CFBP 5494]|uniref:Uncharacterized protein n=1 Tax=Agrobacterium genomosp. 2 str. CFBP 5494 TaxID=1183436 RepID=A0A9W5B2T7_9HYPH|nr:hypothetical protein AGR2A_Cc80016 [Agrobacterium genomosp. 2 str. CFBP 5494]
MDQRNSHCLLKLADGLADGGAGDAQPVRDGAKIPFLGNKAERRNSIEINVHWLEILSIEVNIKAVIATMPERYLPCNGRFRKSRP